MEDEMRTDEFNNTILPMRGELKGLACRALPVTHAQRKTWCRK